MNSISELKVLVVDDKSFVRKVTVRILNSLGVSAVMQAANGKEALNVLDDDSSTVDVILCDLMMPDMDGVEFVRHLATRETHPPIAFVSGAQNSVLRAAINLAKARHLNVLGSIEKPATKGSVERLLSKLDGADVVRRGARSVPKISHDELERGINADELEFHYQPKVEIKSRALHGVEALVRWQHPEHGLLFPDAFVALAERGPLITPMTEKLVEIGIRQAAKWLGEDLAPMIGINLSPSMLSDVTLPERLSDVAASHGVDTKKIQFEITETGVPQDETTLLEIATRMSMKGFGLSIDDFGTGQSSMHQLQSMPFGELKVDREFVDGATHDKTKRAILESSLDLARRLGLKTVAEGVEEGEDWDLLDRLGCDIVQGYFVARPMPPAQIPEWLDEWRASA